MSYSFTVTAPTKAAALDQVSAELDRVVASQPVHQVDRGVAYGAAGVFVSHLRDDDAWDIRVAMHGSVWITDAGLQQVSVGCDASLVMRDGETAREPLTGA